MPELISPDPVLHHGAIGLCMPEYARPGRNRSQREQGPQQQDSV